MGEAKRRKMNPPMMVYHHTSTLRTNLLWMSGQIRTEGTMEPVLHPQLGEMQTDARIRRAMKEFPPVAWFTTRTNVPRCLMQADLVLVDKQGARRTVRIEGDIANAITLNRIALGFRIADIPVTPWPKHPGYETTEGQELNETARDAGDDPIDWYVSEESVDLMAISEVWSTRSVLNPKLERWDWYLADIKKMVAMCRETPGVYIPPTWLKEKDALALAAKLGLPVGQIKSKNE